ncbi:MAG: thioredoxin family protein [Desulfobacteraceae bacterium]|nr:thioredoxin family protein [Desulfobacteraceae bacterium]
MKHPMIKPLIHILVLLIPAFCFAAGAARAKTVSDVYPLLSDRFLKSAELVEAEGSVLLKTGTGISISLQDFETSVSQYDPKLQDQIKENLIFLLDQDIITRILLQEAQKSGIQDKNAEPGDQISAYLASRVKDVTVTTEDAQAFYDENKEMMGGAPFDQVRENIKSFLVERKKQEAIQGYIKGLGDAHGLQINRKWLETQHSIMKNNPVDKARSSGKPSMIEFGAAGCIPCDMMQPILDNLRKKFPDTLNVEFVHVREKQILAGRFGIQSIPVQVFFDKNGNEVFRHTGFFAEKEVLDQLQKMGVQ